MLATIWPSRPPYSVWCMKKRKKMPSTVNQRNTSAYGSRPM